MGFGDITVRTFECYNQPLNEDPDTADLIGPAVVAMQNEQDFMEHVKLTVIAILGRKDLHKFQNMIVDGRVPSFELPDSRVTLSVEPTTEHIAVIPIGGTPIVVKSGHLQILDWVNWWMYENSPRAYRPCPYGATMDQDDQNDGLANSYVVGATYNNDKTGYHVVVVVVIGGDDPHEELQRVSDITVPLVPEGVHDLVYYSLGVLEPPDEGGDGREVGAKDEEPIQPVCVDIVNPAVRQEGAGGFVWKPVSDSNGNAVVLFPPGSPSGAATFNGETGYYRGLTNGSRPTTYFSKPGNQYVAGSVCSGGGQGGGIGDEIEMCGVKMLPGTMDVSFGDPSGELVNFPPIPIRSGNQNYYAKYDEAKQHDIERLAKLFEIRADMLVDDIMEHEDIIGEEDKIDDIYINFGTRIHDNKKASCRYLYLFCQHVLGMANQAGYGFSDNCEGESGGVFYGLGATTESGINCNVISVRSEGYYYEFGFTNVTAGVAHLSEILGDENLREQYEDRQKTTKAWYLSSSVGDGSAGEGYEQPDSAEEYYETILAGEATSEHNIVFYECLPSGAISTLTIYGFTGRMKVTDQDTGESKFVQLNPEDPNSILVPYIPAIGEVLTNHELADCFLSGLVVTILVADITTKSMPWWLAVVTIVMTVVIAWTGYGGALAAAAGDAILAIVAVTLVGYILGNLMTGIVSKYGAAWGAVAAVLAAIVMAILGSGGTGVFKSLYGSIGSLATMSLTDILNVGMRLVSTVSQLISGGQTGDIGREFETSKELYDTNMLELKRDEEELLDEMGGFVGIEPLLDNLLNVSIRTVVNPMDASEYYDMCDDFNEVGTGMLEIDRLFENPFDMDNMLRPV